MRAGSQFGMFGVVRPRMPIRMPATVFTRYSGNAADPSETFRVFEESHGNDDSFWALRRTASPKLKSWFPTDIASYLRALIASAIGSGPFDESFAWRNSIGVPWIVSPASRRSTFGVSLRIAAMREATRARPSSAGWARW